MTGNVPIQSPRRDVIRSSLLPLLLVCAFLQAASRAAEVIPPVPDRYFNDYANVVPQADADQFNQQLDQFERDTSNQIVVAVYPKMQSDSDIADYTVRVKETWHVGQKGRTTARSLCVYPGPHVIYSSELWAGKRAPGCDV